MIKKIFAILIILFIIGGAIAYLYYNKPHKDYSKQKPEYSLNAQDLFNEYSANERQANEKYLGKVISVTGEVVDIIEGGQGEITIVLFDSFFGVSCTIDPQILQSHPMLYKTIGKGDKAYLQGRCDGMLTDVRLSKCSWVENK